MSGTSESPVARGRFVVFEGLDGVGKSTQARLLADRMGALQTREPGGTTIGAQLRRILLDKANVELSIRAEALLMAADRAQHVAEVIEPTLAAGRDVVSDRYLGSSVAYQGYGRGLPVDEIALLSRWAADGLQPDLVFLLVAPLDTLWARRSGAADRLEGSGRAFWQRVAAGFGAQAAQDPRRWIVLDATGPMTDTAQMVWQHLSDHLDG